MERDTMPTDVVFVGAGPANLAAAWRLCKVLEEKGRTGDFEIMIIEKGREGGDHKPLDGRGAGALCRLRPLCGASALAMTIRGGRS